MSMNMWSGVICNSMDVTNMTGLQFLTIARPEKAQAIGINSIMFR